VCGCSLSCKRGEVDSQIGYALPSASPCLNASDLYDRLTIPPVLAKAHHKLDAAADAAYGKRNCRNDAKHVAFLFELYLKYTSLLPAGGIPTAKRTSEKKHPA